MQQKVSVVFPLILILVLVVVLFFYLQTSIEKAAIVSRQQAQELWLKAYVQKCNGVEPDAAYMSQLEELAQLDTTWQSLYECLRSDSALPK